MTIKRLLQVVKVAGPEAFTVDVIKALHMAHEIGGESQAAAGSGDAEAGCKDRRGVVEIVDSQVRNDQVNRVVGQSMLTPAQH